LLNKLKLLIMTKFVIDLTKSVGNDTANNSTANFYKRQLMQNIEELGLTVAGLLGGVFKNDERRWSTIGSMISAPILIGSEVLRGITTESRIIDRHLVEGQAY